jgi:hypothetical protein
LKNTLYQNFEKAMEDVSISFMNLITGLNKGKNNFENLSIKKREKLGIMKMLFKCSYLQGDKCYPMYNGAIAKMVLWC